MMGRLGALVAALTAAVGAAGAAAWARRRADGGGTRTRRRRTGARGRGRANEDRQAGERPVATATASDPVAAAPERPAASPIEPGVDDLRSIKGIGAVSEERLHAIGVTTFAQIAAWGDEDVEAIAARISVRPERIRREDWVAQARAAAEG